MNISDELSSLFAGSEAYEAKLFNRFGVVTNPFPSANQSAMNPRMRMVVDSRVITTIRQFVQGGYRSQSIVIAGLQGVGKTNLLNNYQAELERQFAGQSGIFIVRYLPDPEPSFDAIVKKVLSDLGALFLSRLAESLRSRPSGGLSSRLRELVASADVRSMLTRLASEHTDVSDADVFAIALEWLMGGRVFNLQKNVIGVRFRLDTVESRISALRDLVSVGGAEGVLEAIFLLLDELEKQDSVQPKSAVLRFLFAIRALIDALPYRLFLMLAMTPVARDRYFEMVPALEGRLRNRVLIQPISDVTDAVALLSFYIHEARRLAANTRDGQPGGREILTDAEMRRIFSEQYRQAVRSGASEGVRPRELLHAANVAVDEKFATI